MHEDEIAVDEELVRRLLTSQFPQWADMALSRVESTGTVNAIFRLGDDMSVRLPRTPRWHDIEAEARCLRLVAPHFPVAIPEALVIGEPEGDYPWTWGVFRWLAGETWSLDRLADPCEAARELAACIRALQAVDPHGGPRSSRGGRTALAAIDDTVQLAAEAARGVIDTDSFAAAWEEAKRAPGWSDRPVWVHTDLLAGNVLTSDGRLSAVIDWAGASVGDPARDLTPAWTLFDEGEGRFAFRAELPFDEATWMRARGWALLRINNVAYYAETNPQFSADAVDTIERVLADWSA